MQKELLEKHENIEKISEEIELIFTMIQELKNETVKQGEDIQTISDMIKETNIENIIVEKHLKISNSYQTNINLLKGAIVGIGITGILYYTNPYLLLGGVVSFGTLYSLKKVF